MHACGWRWRRPSPRAGSPPPRPQASGPATPTARARRPAAAPGAAPRRPPPPGQRTWWCLQCNACTNVKGHKLVGVGPGLGARWGSHAQSGDTQMPFMSPQHCTAVGSKRHCQSGFSLVWCCSADSRFADVRAGSDTGRSREASLRASRRGTPLATWSVAASSPDRSRPLMYSELAADGLGLGRSEACSRRRSEVTTYRKESFNQSATESASLFPVVFVEAHGHRVKLNAIDPARCHGLCSIFLVGAQLAIVRVHYQR